MICLKRECDLTGHVDRVWCVSWSPCGSILASCGGDKTVRLWKETVDASNATPVWRTVHVLEGAHTGTIRSCCWSPDGQYLATASFDKTVVLWERIPHTNGEQDGWESVAALEGHESEVKGVAWNPNGSLMATCGRDKTVWFWESQPGEDFDVVDVKHGHSQDVKAVVWHPHGELLASVSYDDSVKLWMESEDSEWVCVKTLTSAHASTVWDVAFDAHGSYMVTCSDDRTIKIWKIDCASHGESVVCTLVKTLSGIHTRSIYSIDVLSKDEKLYIVTGGGDNVINVVSFDTVSEELTVVAQQLDAHSQDVNCVRWKPCSDLIGCLGTIASAGDDCVVTLWNVIDNSV